MAMEIRKACRKKQKMRVLIESASGGGKTFSALTLAKPIAESLDSRICVIDSEKGSSELYAGYFDFDVLPLEPPYSPANYIMALDKIEKAGYKVCIIDSTSHEWSGNGGCLEYQNQLGGAYTDWAKVTPKHNQFIERILSSKMHIIATARTKTDYAQENVVTKSGKVAVKPIKVGLKTEQRDGYDYEFTTVIRLDHNHNVTISKNRAIGLFTDYEGMITEQAGQDLLNWLESGELEPEQVPEIDDDGDVMDPAEAMKEITEAMTVEKPTGVQAMLAAVKAESAANKKPEKPITEADRLEIVGRAENVDALWFLNDAWKAERKLTPKILKAMTKRKEEIEAAEEAAAQG